MPFPLTPPRSWFEKPEASEPTPLTFEKTGQVYGHLALWESCHRGFLNGRFSECVKAPRSQSDYSQFHLAPLETSEGDVRIGKLTYDTGHAPLTADLQAASSHYDNTGAVGAFVKAVDGQLGPWLAGAVRSDLSPEGFRDLRANPPSGDWRAFRHNLELIASLAVPVPGFPITRSQLALSAAADGDMEVTALILTGPTFADLEEEEEALVASASYRQAKREISHSLGFGRDRAFMRRRSALSASVQDLTAATLTAKKRKSLSRSSFAIPETRSYPIHDRAHAANALARASGKPEEARVKRAVCRRYPDMPACR
jgi:hypothetical protein